MKKILFALLIALFATNMMAQTGLTCDDPIPVDENYRGRVEGPCEVWYTAYTYDLPLTVYFSPDASDSDWGPEVVVDFTCTPGEYEDPELANVIATVTDLGFELPVEFLCDRVFRNGKYAYDLSIGKFYRDQLVECGITHNVQAFVKVTFFEAGEISLRPDTLFKNCMENSHYIKLGDTIDIQANDSNQVFVMAYPDWVDDSTRIVWDGEEPAQIWLATTTCDFEPKKENVFVYKQYETSKEMPYKLYKEDMKLDIENSTDGGIFYAKIVSPSSGRLVVEKIPMSDALGGATVFEYDQPVQVAAKDSVALFAIPKTWRKATQFVIEGGDNVRMDVSNNYLFETSSSSVFVNQYTAMNTDGQLAVSLTSAELRPMINKVIDNYLYVRFVSNTDIAVTPVLWGVSECIDNTQSLFLNTTFTAAKGGNVIYRINYSDIEGYDLTIKWDGNSRMYTYIGDTCFFAMTSNNSHLIHYENFSRKGTSLIEAATVRTWKDRVDADGYIYARFNPSTAAKLTLITTEPEVIVPDTIYTAISETLCYGESYAWNGQTYSTAGEYKQSFTATNGADSIVTLQLTILPEVAPTKEEATIEAGETYTWNGKEYTEAGEYTITLQDKNGCDYQATLVLKVKKPLSPCLQSSIKLNVGDEVVINLDSAFTVYAIDYAAWMAQPVTLVWTGAEALHTFVAETCVFALAPYNKYVHAYVPVPAQGDSVLDMEALAPYVDEDGYLYVRFLTEFEGVLTIDN